MERAFHIDTRRKLQSGDIVETGSDAPTHLGNSVRAEFQAINLGEPRSDSISEQIEKVMKLDSISRREFIAEFGRRLFARDLTRRTPTSRLDAIFACKSYEDALRFAKKLRLPPGTPIFGVLLDGHSTEHDVSWLDNETSSIEERIKNSIRYWIGERVDSYPHLVDCGHISHIEIVFSGRMVVGDLAGVTLR